MGATQYCSIHGHYNARECPRCKRSAGLEAENTRLKAELTAEKQRSQQLADGCDSARVLLRILQGEDIPRLEQELAAEHELRVAAEAAAKDREIADLKAENERLNQDLDTLIVMTKEAEEKNKAVLNNQREVLCAEVGRWKERAEKAEAELAAIKKRWEDAPVVKIDGFFDPALRYMRVQGTWVSPVPDWHVALNYEESYQVKLVRVEE